jgi:hypothetical protein
MPSGTGGTRVDGDEVREVLVISDSDDDDSAEEGNTPTKEKKKKIGVWVV